MDEAFWLARWSTGQIAFHEGAPNRWLAEHVLALGPGAGRRVLVPLCGKSIDLAFLAAHGFEVVGVELALAAGEAFFDEAGLAASRDERGAFVRLRAGAITIVVGDFFAMGPEELGTFDAFYDRAAVVALPARMRERYAAAVMARLAPDAVGLIVTFEHDAPADAPPFSVTEAELERIWPELERASLGSVDVIEDRGVLRDRGATFAMERAYAVRRA